MARLPDRFDLWVRRARAHADPERQADLVLGALSALPTWFFLNLGSAKDPRPAETELEGITYLLLFTEAQRIEDMTGTAGGKPPPVIAIPGTQAPDWVLGQAGNRGLLVNPAEDAFAIQRDRLHSFYEEWRQRGGRAASGFWIPEMTGEEESFWQENGM